MLSCSVWSLLPDVSPLLSYFALWSLVVRPHRFIFAQHYFLLGLEEDWLWLPLGCLCATSGFCPQTPILKRLTDSKVYLLNLPYPMPLIGLFNFVAGFAAEVAFFNWSNFRTTFASIYPSPCSQPCTFWSKLLQEQILVRRNSPRLFL